jgi:hypothetical protein
MQQEELQSHTAMLTRVMTREDAKREALALLAQWGLAPRTSQDKSETSFEVFGQTLREDGLGWAVRLIATPSKCLDGIDFELAALFRFGPYRMAKDYEWEWAQQLHGEAGSTATTRTWTTSAFPTHWEARTEPDPTYLPAVSHTFEALLEARIRKEAGRKQFGEMVQRYGADNKGKFSGPHHDAHIWQDFGPPTFSLTVRTKDSAKIDAILAILNS